MGLLTSAATVLFLCACGTGLALYAVHVQRSRLEDANYRALCDVDDTITCSEIIAEEYGIKAPVFDMRYAWSGLCCVCSSLQ